MRAAALVSLVSMQSPLVPAKAGTQGWIPERVEDARKRAYARE
jgi:hypothetical protein